MKENITYCERVQFDRFGYANHNSIFHLNNMGKNKQLANIFLTAPYCLKKFGKMYKVTSFNDKLLWIFCFNSEGSLKVLHNTLFPMYFKWGISRNFSLFRFILWSVPKNLKKFMEASRNSSKQPEFFQNFRSNIVFLRANEYVFV